MDKRSDIELCDIVALPLKLNKVRKRGEEKESARLKRINELAHKAKTEGLTETEKAEQAKLDLTFGGYF